MKREELLKNAKPILFNTEMVKAILENRKTVTRRVVKRQHLLLEDDCKHEMGFFDTGDNDWACRKLGCGITNTGKSIYHAPYQVGDILYVRETFRYVDLCSIGWDGDIDYEDKTIQYKASQKEFEEKYKDVASEYDEWKPSIHMPKEAARIFLKVTGVRVERLQCVNGQGRHDDILKEGYPFGMKIEQPPILMFEKLWNSTINKQDLDSYGWEANPYVWVIEFEKVNY